MKGSVSGRGSARCHVISMLGALANQCVSNALYVLDADGSAETLRGRVDPSVLDAPEHFRCRRSCKYFNSEVREHFCSAALQYPGSVFVAACARRELLPNTTTQT